MSKFSENEDDPEVYESSGEEWDKEDEKSSNRRASQRLSKKPRTVVEPESSSEEEESESEDTDSEEEPRKRKSKNGVTNKKEKEEKAENCDSSSEAKANNSDTNSSHSETKVDPKTGAAVRGIHRKFIPKTIFSEDYATGSFVILKKDAQVGDPAKHPSIWRIDGKALLQKYEAFDEEEKVRHKNTSIYTGWSPMDRDLYAPVTVDVIHHNNQNLTVELHWDKLKEVVIDSD